MLPPFDVVAEWQERQFQIQVETHSREDDLIKKECFLKADQVLYTFLIWVSADPFILIHAIVP